MLQDTVQMEIKAPWKQMNAIWELTPIIFSFYFYFGISIFISGTSILESTHLLYTCDSRVHFQAFW